MSFLGYAVMVICEPRAIDEINVRNGSLETLPPPSPCDEITWVKVCGMLRRGGREVKRGVWLADGFGNLTGSAFHS